VPLNGSRPRANAGLEAAPVLTVCTAEILIRRRDTAALDVENGQAQSRRVRTGEIEFFNNIALSLSAAVAHLDRPLAQKHSKNMDSQILKLVGQIAGVGGLAQALEGPINVAMTFSFRCYTSRVNEQQ
jgi:hypothetical protein